MANSYDFLCVFQTSYYYFTFFLYSSPFPVPSENPHFPAPLRSPVFRFPFLLLPITTTPRWSLLIFLVSIVIPGYILTSDNLQLRTSKTACSVVFLGLGYTIPHDLFYFLPFTCSRDFQWCLCSYSCALLMRPLCLNFFSLRLFLCRPHSFPSQTDAEMLGKVTELFFPTAHGERFLLWVLGGSVGDSTRFESGLWTGAKGNDIRMPSSLHHPAFSRLLT